MRSCDVGKANAGFSMLEVLITLSVIALTIAMLSGRTPEPSVELRFASLIAEVKRDAAARRAQAIVSRQPVRYDVEMEICDERPASVIFFPDGTVSNSSICLAIGDEQRTLVVHPLTGQIQEAQTP